MGQIVDVTDLSRSFGTKRALDGVSFRATAGQVYGLVGANGAALPLFLAPLSLLIVLALAGNAFGIRRRQGRAYMSAFEATHAHGTAQLAAGMADSAAHSRRAACRDVCDECHLGRVAGVAAPDGQRPGALVAQPHSPYVKKQVACATS